MGQREQVELELLRAQIRALAEEVAGLATDHGTLTGLADDDHTQYAKTDGSRGDGRVASGISFTPAGSIASTNIQDAIEEVASEAGGGGSNTAIVLVALSDETSPISTTGTRSSFRIPFAMTVTEVRASATGATSSGTLTFDINEEGTSILSTKITIDATELTSETAVTAPVISDSALADDAAITVDLDDAGDGNAYGLKVTLIGTYS